MAVITTIPPSLKIAPSAIQVVHDMLGINGLTSDVFLINTRNVFKGAEASDFKEAKIDINDYGFSPIYRINPRNNSDRPLLDTVYESYEGADNLSEVIEVTNQLSIELANAFAFP